MDGNFFKSRREQLSKSQFEMAVALGLRTPSTVSGWEQDRSVPAVAITVLASVYGVPESRMEREVMALRRRIEARELAAAK